MEHDFVDQDVRDFVYRLDDAARAHMDWSQRILRCAVLHTSPGQDVLAADAHARCTFGSWFLSCRNRFDAIDPVAAQRLDEQHRLMHDAARIICRCVLKGTAGEAAVLDSFEHAQVSVLADLALLKTKYWVTSGRLDALTGLRLRYGLEEEFNRYRAQARRRGEMIVVVMLDVDHFKRVNDEFGHTTGDIALQHIAHLLLSRCRSGEPLFRYGGEEFLAMLLASNREEAQQAAERLLQALRDNPLILPDGHVLSLRVSAGLATVGDKDCLEEAVNRADQALYAAKAAGRDTLRWSETANE
ncbi:diguanylate cyclase [Rhodoferax sp. GW822-FHT02A01]|uniref:diguanylate cyclase n=1 Tax=Rhodoferax sp. GW822-FHT02A01 TaxID=3141537 RepID=UPI00315CF2B9